MAEETKIPIVPVVSGEVFLQDKVVDDQHCYICKKDVDKYNTEDVVLLRLGKGKMGFCCTGHKGIVKEFVKQFNRLPHGWEKHEKTVEDINSDDSIKPRTRKQRKRPKKKFKTSKRPR